jgi:hypothetical protein
VAAKTWQGPILGILGCRGGPELSGIFLPWQKMIWQKIAPFKCILFAFVYGISFLSLKSL